MRIIAHLDMDAFFAAVEERDKPRIQGKPIVVGSDPEDGKGRGIVSTANYRAREYGIRSALPISTAWRFSEEARRAGKDPVVFLGVDFKKYGAVSDHIMKIITGVLEHARPPKFPAGNLERASVDEAYFDLSFSGSYKNAEDICRKIKNDIKGEERLTASVGIGPNKLIAKIASDIEKPDGLTIVREEEAEKFLEPLSLRTIPGIGPKTEAVFKKLGASRVFDLKKYSPDELKELLGKWGDELYKKIRGKDSSPIVEEYEAKSIGEQETFAEDTRDPGFLSSRLRELCAGVFESFKKSEFTSFRTLVVTVRFADFVTKNRSRTFQAPIHSKSTLEFESLKLLMPFFDKRENPSRKAIRLIGVRIEKLQ